jgi:hypothetical protein
MRNEYKILDGIPQENRSFTTSGRKVILKYISNKRHVKWWLRVGAQYIAGFCENCYVPSDE